MNKKPKLRFKEFSGDWESKKLGDLGEFRKTYSFSRNVECEGKYKHIHYGDIHMNYNGIISKEKFIPSIDIEDRNDYEFVKERDIIFADASEDRKDLGKVAVVRNIGDNVLSGLHTICFRPDKDLNSEFFLNHSLNKEYLKFMYTRGNGAKVLGISKSNLIEYKFLAPSLEEQEKIASFFYLIDKKISLQSEKVEMLREYKKGMMQKIFSRELRFKDDSGRDYPEWEDGKVKNIITEHLYQVEKPSNSYWRLGLRSHGKGTFYEYVTDPSKISMDKLYEVKKDMLIVNITFAWEHAIAVTEDSDEGKLVSHRFPTYDFNDNAVKDFYKYYVLLPKFKHYLENASPGGAGRNRVLNKKQFLEIYAPIPCVEEQNKIASVLGKLDKKIQKEQEKLDSLNEYKKGLLQQMFV